MHDEREAAIDRAIDEAARSLTDGAPRASLRSAVRERIGARHRPWWDAVMAWPALAGAAVVLVTAIGLMSRDGAGPEGRFQIPRPAATPLTTVRSMASAGAPPPVPLVEPLRQADEVAAVPATQARAASVVATVPFGGEGVAGAAPIEIEPLSVEAVETQTVALEGIESAPLAIDALPIDELPPLAPIEVE